MLYNLPKTYPWMSCISEVSHSLYHSVMSLSAKSRSSSTILLNLFPYANVKTMEDFPYLFIRFYVDFFSIFRGLFKAQIINFSSSLSFASLSLTMGIGTVIENVIERTPLCINAKTLHNALQSGLLLNAF